ncbi:porin [Plastorhodobacter daqingensis]|uniref:Porin n=1 Tax=Plastorhodobacter daqingensis TaxID=1387281 RepID=A0ABW2UHB7_9RHOB
MKKILFATTALVMTAGAAAAADVAVRGDARMGVLYDGNEWGFTSRARVQFNLSGETDGGLTFGGSFRVNDEGGANTGDGRRLASEGSRGTVFIAGPFGRLAMGAPAGAAEAAVGDLHEVGLTGLGFYNEVNYLTGDGDGIRGPWNPTVLYSYTFGDVTFYASASDGRDRGGRVENPALSTGSEDYGVGLAWAAGDFKIAAGFESSQVTNLVGDPAVLTTYGRQEQWVLGGDATFGDFTLRAIYANGDRSVAAGTFDYEEYGISGSATFDLITVTAFARETRQDTATGRNTNTYYGLGGRYDLGGGAALVGGIGYRDLADGTDDTYGDFGVTFRF